MFTAALPDVLILGPLVADADQESAIGISDTEIRIGHIIPSTGPLAAFATLGNAEAVARGKPAFSEAKLLFNGLIVHRRQDFCSRACLVDQELRLKGPSC
jgi:hypothetical protein